MIAACTYDDSGRMTSTEYIQSLERKVSELEGLLGGPGPSGSQSRTQSQSQSQASPEKPRRAATGSDGGNGSGDDVIEAMLDASDSENENRTSQSPPGSAADSAGFGGLSLLRRVHRLCKHVSGSQQDGQPRAQDGGGGEDLVDAFDVSPPESDSPISWEAFALLPCRKTVETAIDIVLNQACCNMQFMSPDYLDGLADEVFEEAETDGPDRPRKPLALLYSILALSKQHNPIVPAIDEKKRPATSNG